MALKFRQEIKPSFQNGVIPTAQDFGHLIDSMLNKRDDKFHGAWKPGVLYYEGEVVIYGKTMYLLYNPATGIPSAAATTGSKSPQPQPTTTSPTPFSWCSTCPPPDDPLHWCQLEFDFEDKDWHIEPDYIYAYSDKKKVGIGINQGTATNATPSPPQAKLHIFEEGRGQFKFNPDTPADRTEFRMESCNQPSNCGDKPYLSQHLEANFTHFETNAKEGFSFDFPLPVSPPTTPPTTGVQPLMVVTGSAQEPEVGIGTSEPTASLQVTDPGVGDFQVNPSGGTDPLLALKNLGQNQNDACIEVTVHHDFADLKTNATEGFRFGPKEVAKPASATAAKSVAQNLDSVGVTGGTSQVVVVDVDRGYVGIGTEQPTTRLEVTDQKLGSIQLSVDEATPSIVLLNLEDTLDKSTIFAAGVDNANAILQTDAGCGFVFRVVEQTELNLRPDINAGEDVVFIDNKGNTGIQRPPGDYQLDVDGTVRQFENYVPHNKTTMDNPRVLDKALDIVCSLTPLRFTWKSNLDAASNLKPGDHFGFKESDVEQYAKEVCKVVKVGGQNEKSVNLMELIPVLFGAIREQQALISDLTNRVKTLESATGKGPKSAY